MMSSTVICLWEMRLLVCRMLVYGPQYPKCEEQLHYWQDVSQWRGLAIAVEELETCETGSTKRMSGKRRGSRTTDQSRAHAQLSSMSANTET